MDRHSILIEEMVSLIKYNKRRKIKTEFSITPIGNNDVCEIIFKKDGKFLYSVKLNSREYSDLHNLEFSSTIIENIEEKLNFKL